MIQYYKKLSDVETHSLILELMKRYGIHWSLDRQGPYPYAPFTLSLTLENQDIEKLGKEQDFRDMMQKARKRSNQINKEIIENQDWDRLDRILENRR